MKDALIVELVHKKQNGDILVEKKEFIISMVKRLNFVDIFTPTCKHFSLNPQLIVPNQ